MTEDDDRGLIAQWNVVSPWRDEGCGTKVVGLQMVEVQGTVWDFGGMKDEGYDSTTPLDCNVRKPMDRPGRRWVEMIRGRDEAPPTCERSILRANAQPRRSRASKDHISDMSYGFG